MKKIFKNIFQLLPFKQETFGILRHLFIWPNAITKHLYFNGIIDFKVGDKKVYMHQNGYDVENTLFWRGINGCWEANSVKLWYQLSQISQGAILDIGANTGAYALISKTCNPTASVHAFEPLSVIYDMTMKNVKLNQLDIKVNQLAISDYTGKAIIYAQGFDHLLYSVTVNKNLNSEEIPVRELEIDTITLAEYVEKNNVPTISLIKWDIETHEPEGLRGMGKYLDLYRPTMLIEILNEEVGKAVEEIVKDMDYLYFNIHEFNGIRQTAHIEKSDYYNYLLCHRDIAKQLKLI